MPLLTYDELGALQGGAGSIREDLMDFIEILSPSDTPLFNNLGAIKVNAGYVEYLEDSLTAAANNAWPEGAQATDITLTAPSRNASLVQNYQKHFHVSGRQQAVLHAGMSSMLSHQEMKAVREIKTDIELALHRGSAVTGTTTAAAHMVGLLNLASTNATQESGVTLTEKVFNDILSLAYSYNVNLREMYANLPIKRTVNQYTTSVTRFLPAADRRQYDIIDVYESEVGVLALFKSRYQLTTTNLQTWVAIDPEYFQVGWLRPLNTRTLGIDGDRERRMIVGECTLIYRSEKAAVACTGCTTYIT